MADSVCMGGCAGNVSLTQTVNGLTTTADQGHVAPIAYQQLAAIPGPRVPTTRRSCSGHFLSGSYLLYTEKARERTRAHLGSFGGVLRGAESGSCQ